MIGRSFRGLALLLVLLAPGCWRYETVWSGVQRGEDERTLQVAADPGLCGCVTFVNRSAAAVQLRATSGGVLHGSATLAPGQSLTARFDWAGDTTDHEYVIDAVDAAGRAIEDIGAVIEARAPSGSRSCRNPGCDWGPLNMRAAMGAPAP